MESQPYYIRSCEQKCCIKNTVRRERHRGWFVVLDGRGGDMALSVMFVHTECRGRLKAGSTDT